MNKKLRVVLSIVGVAVLIGVALTAYQILSDRVEPQVTFGETADEPVPAEGTPAEGDETGSETSEAAETRDKAPDFTVLDRAGNAVKLSDMLGKPVVLNFWASWCPPCVSEMPEFDAVYTEIGGDVTFMMVDLTDGQRETVETAIQFITEQGLSLPIYFDTTQEAANTYGITSIPTTIFIDAEGYIVTGSVGAIDAETLREGIGLLD